MEKDGSQYGLCRKYFKLDNSIHRTEQHIQQTREHFYNQTMSTRTIAGDDLGMVTVGFRPDREVVDFVDYIAGLEEKIERNLKKKRYLEDYLSRIPSSERYYLMQRYVYKSNIRIKKEFERSLIEEINEIEEAINRMYGLPLEPKEVAVETDETTKISDVLALLGVVT